MGRLSRLAFVGRAFLGCTLASVGVAMAYAECAVTELVTALGERASTAVAMPRSGGVKLVPAAAIAQARYVRIRVELSGAGSCPWSLIARDDHYRPIHVFSASDFAAGSIRWTPRIPGPQAVMELLSCPGIAGPTIRFGEYVWMPASAKNPYYSIQGSTPLYRDLYADSTPTNLRRFGDAIGFLLGSFGRESWVCSGVMIADDLFLTNWHCGGPGSVPGTAPGSRVQFPDGGYWSQDVVRDAVVDLSWDGDPISREVEPVEVVAKDRDLDFALLRVSSLDQRGLILPAPIRAIAVTAGEPLMVVHHPEGHPKRITFQSCTAVDVGWQGWSAGSGASDFTHVCDTEGGSSGAPILDAEGRIVGLHHLGFDIDANSCQPILTKNKAVHIGKILEALRRDHPGIAARLAIR